jgi:hypothetical protein
LKEEMDAVWALSERLESLERTLKVTLKYIKGAREDLERAVGDVDREYDYVTRKPTTKEGSVKK